MRTNRRIQAVPDLSREERTRAEILDAALRLFQRLGIRKTTLEDIAGALGKKKSFLYYYYAGKDDIVTACVQREMNELLAHTRAEIARQPTPQAKVHAFFAAPLLQMLDRIRVFGQAVDEMRAGGSELGLLTNLRATFYDRETQLLQQILEEGVQTKVFRPLKPSAMESLCGFAVAAMSGIEMGFVWGTVPEAALKHLDEVTGILVRGLEA